MTKERDLPHLRREGVLPVADRVAGLHDVVVVGEGGVDEGEVAVQRLDHLRRRAVRHEVVRVRRVPREGGKKFSLPCSTNQGYQLLLIIPKTGISHCLAWLGV